MNPHDITNADSEGQNQAALFAYLRMVRAYGINTADSHATWTTPGWAAANGDLQGRCNRAHLDLVFAVPNGSHLAGGARGGAQLRAQGVKSGVFDICCPVPKHVPWSESKLLPRTPDPFDYHGLWVELKTPAGLKKYERAVCGDDSTEGQQKLFRERMTSLDYRCEVRVGWRSAAEVILGYLGI